MDLLFGENVLLLAKVTEAAVNQSDEYAAYATVMAANGDDLTNLVRLAFGSTAASDFSSLWAAQDASYVDYVIGVVTHNQEKANAAMARLGSESAANIAGLFATLLHVPVSALIEPLHNQLTAIKMAIDDQFGQNYRLAYREIDGAYGMGTGFGDFLAPLIAKAYPDKFPGDMSTKSVTSREVTNHLLQERAYFLTMATDAIVNGRGSEAQEASAALATNADMLERFKDLWVQQAADVAAYAATGDSSSKRALTQDFVTQLSATAHVPASLVTDETSAMVKVIDDQRAKAFKTVAGDDRAAATAMQPIADAMAAA